MARAGLEPGTAGLRVRRDDHSVTLPPLKARILYTIGEVRLCIHEKLSRLLSNKQKYKKMQGKEPFPFACTHDEEKTQSDGLDNTQQNGDIV